MALRLRHPVRPPSCPAIFLFSLLIFFILPNGPLQAQPAKPAKPTFPAVKKPGGTGEPIHLQSDRLEYLKEEDVYLAEGSVVVQQGPLHLEADTLRLDNAEGKLVAIGNVHFSDGENRIDAEEIELDINTQLGILYDGNLFVKSDHYYLAGETIERRALDRYYLEEGSFTACDFPEDPAWRIKARRLRIRMDHYLVARDVVFYANGIPIFYLPYLIYPVKTERQTGLLVPRVGYSSRYGFRYGQDLYWAISQSQDATFSFEHRGSKGDGLGLEYRYALSKGSGGELQTDYLYDRENHVGRWDIRYRHEQRFTERLTAKLDLRYLNEEDSLRELSDQTVERARQNIESNFFLTYRGNESFAYLLARYTQDLTAQGNDATVHRLPEVGYSLIQHRLGASPVFFNFESTAVNFWRAEGLKANRIDLYPKLSLPISLAGAATLTPWAGFRETWYSRGTLEDNPIARETIPAGVALESPLYRRWGTATHLITPSVHYEYIAAEDLPDTPRFDEVDRIHDRSAVTLSLSQRFLTEGEKGEPVEKIYFRLTESYHFQEARSAAPDSRPYSDLRAEWTVHPVSQVTLRIDSFYDFYDHRFSSWNTDVLFDLPPYLNLSLGQRHTHSGLIPQKGDLFNPLYLGDREIATPVEFWTGRILIKTPWGVSLVSRAYFDAEVSKFVEIDYGLQYEQQCWGITLAYIDLRTRNEFSFMISLKGLGNTGSSKFANLF